MAKKLGATIPGDGQWLGSRSSKCGNNYNRPDLLEMQAYCKRHQHTQNVVKYLIVAEPDRFMRSVNEAFYWEGVFLQLGVTVMYTDEQLNTGDMQAKLMRFMQYFVAEGSNEERKRKSISGGVNAILEGRYPYAPKLGYRRGPKAGIYVQDHEASEPLQKVLKMLANKEISLSESLRVFNNSAFMKSGKRRPYKLDKWRKIVTDPYYAGIVEINKQVQARNEHGLHEALITIVEHEKIIEVVSDKKKSQLGPRKGGNPNYPLNAIALCESCTKAQAKIGKIGRHNNGKFVGYDGKNGHSSKIYPKYKCRECGRLIAKAALHQAVTDFLNDFDLSAESRKCLKTQLSYVWEQHMEIQRENIAKLEKKKVALGEQKTGLIDQLGFVSNRAVYGEIENRIHAIIEDIRDLDNKVQQIKGSIEFDREEFLDFALQFADHLGEHFLKLTPTDAKMCKELLFPSGLLVTEDGKLYTTEISPLYRLRTNKKGLKSPKNVNMVRAKRL